MSEVGKSQGDNREYRYVQLNNGLKCLLVCDGETDYGAAALSVASGSLSDPGDIQGLSHFLEHMLFLGTSVYPLETTYRSFIKSHSGNFNAFTTNEETNYYFSISHPHLRPALHIFAQFFICPLFTEDCVDREMNAVDSENQKNLKNDTSRLNQIICSLAEENHPVNHFSTGNLKTLKVENIRERLMERFREKYSAGNMGLVVYGRESLDELQIWVSDCFSSIPNPPISPFPVSLHPWTCLGSLLKVKSVMSRKELKLLWPWPPVQQLYKSKPHHYISHLLGHEGKNSILSMLKKEELAQEVGAGVRTSLKDLSVFAVNVTLTEKGIVHWEDVVHIVTSYIHMLQSTPLQPWVFTELQSMSDIKFRFQSKSPAMEYVRSIASDMHKYPPSSVLTGSHLMSEYDPEGIRELVEMMRGDRMMVVICWEKWTAEDLGRVEKWYGTEYGISKLSDEFMQRLATPIALHSSDIVLAYPPINPYIPSEFPMIEPSSQTTPSLILDQPGISLHHLPDITFSKDSIHAVIYVKCPDAGYWLNPLTAVLVTIWVRLVNDSIRETAYLAEKAGLNFNITKKAYGLVISLSGFSQHFQSYLHHIFTHISSFTVDETHRNSFNQHLQEVRKHIHNAKLTPPHLQARRRLSDLLHANFRFTTKAKKISAENCDFDDFVYFSGKWLKNVRLEWLIVGNISHERSIAMTRECSACFLDVRSKAVCKEDLTPRRNYIIESPAAGIIYQKQVFDATNPNSASVCYWESGPETPESRAALKLLENIYKEPCFSYLRTKQQLGYIVFSSNLVKRGLSGHIITVQSHRFPAAELTNQISTFISNIRNSVENLTDEEFDMHKNAVLTGIMQKDISLHKRFLRFKSELISGRGCFEWREIMGNAVREITKEQVQRTFREVFEGNGKRVNVEMVSRKHVKEQMECNTVNTRKVMTSITQIQRFLPIYTPLY